MNHRRAQNDNNIRSERAMVAPVFGGFAEPTSNTTYVPNQFFDVCLPHRSRGCVRIVARMLRKTLGWSDANGQPLRERFTFSYDDLITEAGVSRDMLKLAIDESIQFGFVNCLRTPFPNRPGTKAVSGLYELRWDERAEYIKDPKRFGGFFAGEGNRTYVPNQFFDVVVRRETLAVVKVVGSIARFSIGFANKFGHRRQHAALSFMDLRRYARFSDRTTLASAIRLAIERRYVQIVHAGFFDKAGGRTSAAASYALRWLNHTATETDGQKTRPGEFDLDRRSEIQTGNGRKTRPGERSENQTDIQITVPRNNNPKQQEVVESVLACCSTLKDQGFDATTAERFARAFPVERVLNQIEWLPLRGVARNRIGLLRRAIEGNWPKPGTQKYGRPYFGSHAPAADSSVDEARRRLAYQFTRHSR